MNDDIGKRLWHPWLRINLILRVMLSTRWNPERWPQVKAEFKKALAMRSEIRRAGWFNQNLSSRPTGRYSGDSRPCARLVREKKREPR